MKSRVFFTELKSNETTHLTAQKIQSLFNEAALGDCITRNDLTAVKMHFGEKGNETHISPDLVRPVVQEIRKHDAKPFLTDTCVLYKSQRDNAVDHLSLAHEHGFTLERTGAPVIIADGLIGHLEKTVPIPGKLFKEVSISSLASEVNSLIVLTHVTGHMGTGIGGAIKNIGMGFASRKGKLRQHSVMKPAISSKKCTGCELCVQWCPEDAISMSDEIAYIDSKKCIGCGECLTVCRFDAVQYDWRVSEKDLQIRMAEHALGVTHAKSEKIGYMNFMISITKDCDCIAKGQNPVLPDIGILASTDPVAIDAASLNIILDKTGKSLTDVSYPRVDPWAQIKHGEAIGLGKTDYDLVEVE
ncbi:DUF362 domain-containing protein [bacterium]